MNGHKFEIGRVVRAETGPARSVPAGNYEIVQQLPARDADRDPQYRIKAVADGHERIVRQSDIR